MEEHPDLRKQLQDAVKEAEANTKRIREQNSALSDDFRKDPSEAKREILKRAAQSLADAKEKVDAAKTALAIFDKKGSPHGLLAQDGKVVGSVALKIPPGTSHEKRIQLIDEALTDPLDAAAKELGAVLAATPERFTKERPGRDANGCTVLDVAGRVEGDRLVPAISRASKLMRH